MTRPLLLDLFCGAGGAAVGYHRAGFDVIGVDNQPQPHYPFPFIQADALHPPVRWSAFDAVHASPPCHAFSTVTGRNRKSRRRRYPNLVDDTRHLLDRIGLPWVIENVPGAPIAPHLVLCGSSFGLDLRRHRWFETGGWRVDALQPPCAHGWQRPRFRSLDSRSKTLASVVGVHGHLSYPGELELRRQAMGIDWMTNAELAQAIPPAYTEHIGRQLLDHLRNAGVLA